MAKLDAVKARLKDADDGHVVVVESEGLADDLRIGRETRLPVGVVEDDVGVGVGDAVVFGSEDTTEIRIKAEGGEVVAGDQLKINAFSLTVEREAAGESKTGEHVGEDIVVSSEIAEHGMRDGVAAPIAAVVAAVHGEEDEFLGILDGEKAEEDLIEESENGGVSADAKGESEDGNYSEAGGAGEGAQGVLKIAKSRVK